MHLHISYMAEGFALMAALGVAYFIELSPEVFLPSVYKLRNRSVSERSLLSCKETCNSQLPIDPPHDIGSSAPRKHISWLAYLGHWVHTQQTAQPVIHSILSSRSSNGIPRSPQAQEHLDAR